MKEKDIITITKLNSLTINVIANFIDDEDKFIKQQIIDHIIRNDKYYYVINVSKQKIKILLEKGAKYEQLKKENEELKNNKINKVCAEFGQEKFDKVIDMFQSKAIDELEFLTNQFKDDFAEDIDKKLFNYKEQFEKMYNNNFKNMQKVQELQKENEELKSAQNKVAIEKLEIVKVKLNEFKVDNFSDAYIVIKDMNFNISTMLTELKGGNDE